MTFISYAQNFEDIMLWRALKHVAKGRYIDIGAQHPVIDSVSKAFYEQGWRGVHVEPVPEYADLLRRDRPDETVLQLALSAEAGVLELHLIPDTGLSTGVKAYAQAHHTQRGFQSRPVEVPMLPIRTALAAEAGKEIHWLKIDVEGFEEEVLRGWDSQVLRPWIIVIEVTVPLSAELRDDGCDKLLTDAGYRFAYFDGLNRFYVAEEHADLASNLQIPPNVFDEAQLSGTSGAWCDALQVRHQAELHSAQDHVRKTLEQLSGVETQMRERVTHTQELLIRSGARCEQAEARATQAETRATQAETRATQAEQRTTQAEARTTQAELNALQAETRATQAEARTIQAEQRTTQAEARTTQAEMHTTQAEERSIQAATRFADAEIHTAAERARAVAAETRATQLETSEAQARQNLAESEHHALATAAQLQAVLSSTSWHVTAPMRKVGTVVRRIRTNVIAGQKTVRTRLKQRTKSMLRIAAHHVVRRPTLKYCAVWLANRVPGLKIRLKTALAPPPLSTVMDELSPPVAVPDRPNGEELSAETRMVYEQLLRRAKLERIT